jgi:hypothetical protein
LEATEKRAPGERSPFRWPGQLGLCDDRVVEPGEIRRSVARALVSAVVLGGMAGTVRTADAQLPPDSASPQDRSALPPSSSSASSERTPPRDDSMENPPPERLPAPPDLSADADAKRMLRLLDLAASQAHRGRVEDVVLDLVYAAIRIPIGVLFVTRSDPGVEAIGVEWLIHGGFNVFGFGVSLFPSQMEVIRDRYLSRRRNGETESAAIAETSLEWQKAAQSERSSRIGWAISDLVLGAGGTALGVAFLVAPPFGNMDRREQTTWGVLLSAVSFVSFANGLASLVAGQSPAERWWRIYQTAADGRVASAPVAPRPLVSLAPLNRGAMGVAGIAF